MRKMLFWILILFVAAIARPGSLSAYPLRSSDDELKAGTKWTGSTEGDPRVPARDKARGAVLNVTQRDGEMFKAQLIIRGNHTFVLELDGQVRDGQVAVKVAKIVKGTWPDGAIDDIWKGSLKGKELVLKHTNKQNQVSTLELSLSEDTDGEPHRKPKP